MEQGAGPRVPDRPSSWPSGSAVQGPSPVCVFGTAPGGHRPQPEPPGVSGEPDGDGPAASVDRIPPLPGWARERRRLPPRRLGCPASLGLDALLTPAGTTRFLSPGRKWTDVDRAGVAASYPLLLADLRQPLQPLASDDLGLLVLLRGRLHLHVHRQVVCCKTRRPVKARAGHGSAWGPVPPFSQQRVRRRHSSWTVWGRARGMAGCLRAARKGARAGPLPHSEDFRLPRPVPALSRLCAQKRAACSSPAAATRPRSGRGDASAGVTQKLREPSSGGGQGCGGRGSTPPTGGGLQRPRGKQAGSF